MSCNTCGRQARAAMSTVGVSPRQGMAAFGVGQRSVGQVWQYLPRCPQCKKWVSPRHGKCGWARCKSHGEQVTKPSTWPPDGAQIMRRKQDVAATQAEARLDGFKALGETSGRYDWEQMEQTFDDAAIQTPDDVTADQVKQWRTQAQRFLDDAKQGGANLPITGQQMTTTEAYAYSRLETTFGEQATGQTEFTPDYWQAKDDLRFAQDLAEKYSDDNPDEAAGFVSDARDQVQLEADLSQAAQQFGYPPDRMSQADWASLAEDLRQHSQQSLRHATDERRQAAGNKLRGKADFVAQVGGQDQLVHTSSFSASDARQHSRALADDSKTGSAAYMQMMLERFGYHDHTTEGLNYDQRRRLLAEIGHGQTQSSRIGHIPDTLRERAVQRATPGLRQAARSAARNPQTAQGIDTWELYREAHKRAGLGEPPDYVPDELFYTTADDRLPAYVRGPQSKTTQMAASYAN